jgi:hypothetical protein
VSLDFQLFRVIHAHFYPDWLIISARVVSQMKRNKRVNTVEDVNYLTRYSNNLLAFSPLQSIDVAPTEQSKDWLFRNYVYDGTRLAV